MSSRIISQNYAPLAPKHSKNLLIYPTRKISPIKFTSSVVKSVIPSPWNCNFHLITLCKLHLWLQPWLLCHFLTSAFKYICDMLILINRCLLNVVFRMTKALNGQRSLKQNIYSLHLPMLLGKPCLFLCFFSSFFDSLFYVKIYKFSTDSTPLHWIVPHGLSADQI